MIKTYNTRGLFWIKLIVVAFYQHVMGTKKLWWSLSCFCLWLLPLHSGCALPLLSVDMIQSHQLMTRIIPPGIKLLKKLVSDWLRPPSILWWWAWILKQIDTGYPFPRGESPPQHTSKRGVTKDAPRGSPFVVICDYLHTKAAAKTGTPIPRIFWTQAVSNSALNRNQVRPEKTLPRHLILLLSG